MRYNPAVVAEAFASLSSLYPGRVFLGVGSGEALNEQAATGIWPKWPERWDRLIEAIGIIRALWTGQQVHHQGKYYNVDAKLYDPPAQPIPLLTAANGKKSMRLAGQYGDGLITDPKTWKQFKSEWEAGAKGAGKNPADMPVLVEQFVVVGDTNDARQAAELWRFIPKAFKKYYNVPDPAAIEQQADQQLPLDQVYGEWPVSTDPSVHVDAVNKLFDSGVTIVNVHSGQPDQNKVVEFYAEPRAPQSPQPLLKNAYCLAAPDGRQAPEIRSKFRAAPNGRAADGRYSFHCSRAWPSAWRASTQRSPSGVSSLFQNGASVLSQSIRKWQAASAASRCGEAVATSTMRSPGSSRP